MFAWLRPFLLVLMLLGCLAGPAAADTLDDIRRRGELSWGTDLEGGAPYCVSDPKAPDGVGGFETEIGRAIARELGVKGKVVHNAWDGLIPALGRKNFDMAFNGLEVTPDRLQKVIFSRPYYVYTQQIVVRKGTRGIQGLRDLKGKRVGTLGSTVAERLLKHMGGVDIKIYPSSVQPFDDLLLGRLDAVLQDLPIAVVYGKREGLAFAGQPFGEGLYAMAFRREDQRLKQAVDAAIGRLIANGELKRILSRYELWNEAQTKLSAPFDQIVADSAAVPVPSNRTFWQQLRDAGPLLARGTAMTITVSVLGMAMAMLLGISLALLRVYGHRALSWLAAAYVEIFRGTPLLIQLFLIYYGLPNLGIQLDAFVAAVVGLGLNYAAYEAENYRAGLLAVPRGQVEAAMALGMSRYQMLREVVVPQAIRIVIPPVTNDFIALFKDSSVVSVITMVELTKAYGMIASETYNYMAFGLVTAAIYFCLSYPTSLFARWLEVRLRPA
ncbi:MAG: ABC transporter substrate-binding protein/permease [Candidatus Sericytochromatia bacterium]|nr:ABC transporter substrate-binding protein/permease [Candidatus Sericytochromatia bacterium]